MKIFKILTRPALTVFLLAGLLFPLRSVAGGCEDISKLSDRWTTLATYIHEHNEKRGDLSEAQVKKVRAEQKVLIPVTRDFGRALVKIDSKLIQSLGKQLVAILEELQAIPDSDGWDDDIKVIDRLVEVIEKTVEECEK